MAREIRLISELGQGGFCIVWEAQVYEDDAPVGEPFAIKFLQDDAKSDPEVVHRFQREGRLLDDVLSHPNVIEVTERNLSAANPWFAMPKADGNLAKELERGRWRDEQWVLAAFRQILEAMAYAHDKDVIHRDLKPANALMFGDTIRISDFGLGKHLIVGTHGLTKTNQWSGTEPYMSPEQFNAMKDTDHRTDVFALGKLFAEMLTGEVPDVGQPDLDDVPEKFRYFISRCCASKTENRYADARAALEAFDRLFADKTLTETPEETLERLVEEWWATSEERDLDVVRKLDEHLRCSAEDEALFTRAVPRLPESIADQYMDELPQEFEHMLAIYDDHVSGGLPFDYCDVVTDYYERIFRRTSDLRVRERIILRLIEMGSMHHRFHVRTRLLTLLSEVREPSTVAMAAEAFQRSPEDAMFFAERASSFALPAAIRDALSKHD